MNNMDPPYIFQQFNINDYKLGVGSSVKGTARLLNPLIDALNENELLPKMILIMPDKDLFMALKDRSFNTALVMGSTLHYLIKQMDLLIERRKHDMTVKKPGALPPPDWPKLIWVRMLK